jgi:hypothetical protein
VSGELVNLNKARKAKAKTEAATRAKENRVRFGLTKGEKAHQRLDVERAARDLDGREREKD